MRAGGKQNDLDDVGRTARHASFFEMLGNFLFGDYFKDGAIDLAWAFATERLSFPRDQLWATVFAGDPELGLGEDEVAVEGWLRVGIPRERIVGLPRAENFWQAADTGPCGPCSELYLDRGVELGCDRPDCAPGCDCDRFLEFWNLVFMEYDLAEDGTLTPLPQQNIDTGLGLERGAMLLQGVDSIFETDGYRLIMDWVAKESGVAYGESEQATKAHRVLADHGRAMTFLVADGIVPGNEGRAYVLRRVVRRAVQHGQRIGLESPFLGRLTDVVIEQMREAYPEVDAARTTIHDVLGAEEERFAKTLMRGLRLFDELAAAGNIAGEDAFRLHDTYGFPVELTVELAEERGLAVDVDGFRALMEEQRERSRTAGPTEDVRAAEFARDAGFRTEFVGSEKTEARTQIGAVEDRRDGTFLVKLRESPFYAAGGGQVTDQGWIEKDDGTRAELREAYRFGDDQALLFEGSGFAEGDRVLAVVPWRVRFPHDGEPHRDPPPAQGAPGGARRPRPPGGLGGAPGQAAVRLHARTGALGRGARRVQELVNERIFENLPVHAFETPLDEAKRLGAMALSARNTATSCAWSRSAPATGRSPASSAAAHTSARPRRSARSRSSPRDRSAPACAGSRRSPPAGVRAPPRPRTRGGRAPQRARPAKKETKARPDSGPG